MNNRFLHVPLMISALVAIPACGSDRETTPRADASAPDVSAPDASAPDVSAPDASASDASAPDVSAPDVSAPDVSAPDASASDASAPDVSAPDASASDAGVVDAAVRLTGVQVDGVRDGETLTSAAWNVDVRAEPSGAEAAWRFVVDGVEVERATGATARHGITGLVAGEHTLRVEARGTGGGEVAVVRTFRVDLLAPRVAVRAPREDTVVAARSVLIDAQALDDLGPVAVTARWNDGPAESLEPDRDGTLRFTRTPSPGRNVLRVDVRDGAGRVTTVERAVHYGFRLSGGNSQAGMIRSGRVWMWGRNENGQIGDGTTTTVTQMRALDGVRDVVSLVTRQTFTLALTTAGHVYAWGDNANGQLGLGTPPTAEAPAVPDTTVRRVPTRVPGLDGVVAIAAGFDHALLLKSDGSVLSMGDNAAGQLGDGSTADRSWPAPVQGLRDVIQVAAGSAHSLALRRDGRVLAWGRNQYGNLGAGASDTMPHTSPQEVPGVERVIALASGRDHTLALRDDGTVLAWGLNATGQVGSGTSGGNVLTPTVVLRAGDPAGALSGVEQVAADGNLSFAVMRDGRVFAWGQGALGQLGMGALESGDRDLTNRASASEVRIAEADRAHFNVVELEPSAGGGVFAYTTEQRLFAWGWSFSGSFGDPAMMDRWAYASPIPVTLP